MLAEDTAGQGHCSKSIDGEGRWSLFLTLPEDPPLTVMQSTVMPSGAVQFLAGVAVGALLAIAAMKSRP